MSDTESYFFAHALFIVVALVAFGIDRFAFHTVEKSRNLYTAPFFLQACLRSSMPSFF